MTVDPSAMSIESNDARTADEGRPVIAGFYPDPSICRVGEDYYLVHSSFEYVPGIPIWHSTDLVNWTQIGNVLDRPGQLHLSSMSEWLPGTAYDSEGEAVAGGTGSDGVYAPTVRHHNGTFYVTTTVANDFRRGPLIVHSADPRGPWSEPVYVEGLTGIDSDLVWDEDGICHMSLSSYEDGGPRILSAPIDPVRGLLLEPARELWSGTGGMAPEAPHLFRREGWWYLTLAEGGTAAGHQVTIARAKDLRGEWEPHPGNPILGHLGQPHAVQYTGHADIVQTATGDWAMVYLGVRLRGFPGFHVNGRETFLAGVDWVDDWPVVHEGRYPVPSPSHDFVDLFTLPLHPRWISPADWVQDDLVQTSAGTTFRASGRRGILGVRTRDESWVTELVLNADEGEGGVIVRLDDLRYIQATAHHGVVVTELRTGDLVARTEHGLVADTGTVKLFARAVPASGVAVHIGPDRVEVGIVADGNHRVLATCDGRQLSTEVGGGFTGRIVGARVLTGEVTLESFTYQSAD